MARVPLDPAEAAQQSRLASNWARIIVLGKLKTKEERENAALYELIRRTIAFVAREVRVPPIPVLVAMDLAEQQHLALKQIIAHDEMGESYGCLLVAFVSCDAQDEDPIRSSHAKLMDCAKRAYVKKETRYKSQLEAEAKWQRVVSSLGRAWIARKIVYEKCLEPPCDTEKMVKVGYAKLAQGLDEARKESIVSLLPEALTRGVASPAAHPASFGGMIKSVIESELGSSIISALGAEKLAKGAAALEARGTSLLGLATAIIFVAKIGESLLMQLVELVVQGLRMLLESLNLTVLGGAQMGPRIQNILRDAKETSEEKRERERKQAEDEQAHAKLMSTLRASESNLQNQISAGNKRLMDMKFGSGPSDAPVAVAPASVIVGATTDALETEKKTGKKSTRVTLGALLGAGTGVIQTVVFAVWAKLGEIIKGGSVLDIFDAMSSSILSALMKNKGIGAKVLALLAAGSFASLNGYFVQVKAWVRNGPRSIRSLLTDPASALPNDSEGETTMAEYRAILTEFSYVAVPAVVLLFSLRIAQIGHRIVGSSVVTEMLCKTASALKKAVPTAIGKSISEIEGALSCGGEGKGDDKKKSDIAAVEGRINAAAERLKKISERVDLKEEERRRDPTSEVNQERAKLADALAKVGSVEALLKEADGRVTEAAAIASNSLDEQERLGRQVKLLKKASKVFDDRETKQEAFAGFKEYRGQKREDRANEAKADAFRKEREKGTLGETLSSMREFTAREKTLKPFKVDEPKLAKITKLQNWVRSRSAKKELAKRRAAKKAGSASASDTESADAATPSDSAGAATPSGSAGADDKVSSLPPLDEALAGVPDKAIFGPHPEPNPTSVILPADFGRKYRY
jgi:hypothetical protein